MIPGDVGYQPQNAAEVAAQKLAAQRAQQGLTADQAGFSRDQSAMDTAQSRDAYTGLLTSLRNNNFLSNGASSSTSGGGAWTPAWGGSSGGSSGAPTAPPPVSSPGSVGAVRSPAPVGAVQSPRPVGGGASFVPVASIAPVDTTAAQSAAFARAKDQVGQTSAGALAGLRSSLASHGMLGSGSESRGTAAVVNAGQGQLGDVSRQQAIDSAANAQRTAEFNATGGITQRGQDIASADTQRGQDVTQRGQDVTSADTQRGQDVTQRGQDVGLAEALRAQDVAQRGQDVSAATDTRGQDITLADTQRGQDVTARGQTIDAATAAANRAATLQQSQLDAILGLYKSYGAAKPAGQVY